MTTPIAVQIAAEHARRDALAPLVIVGATVTIAINTRGAWKVVTGVVKYAPDEAGELLVQPNGRARLVAGNVRDVTEVR